MDREIKFAGRFANFTYVDLSDAFDPIGLSCSEIMDEQNSQNESFFIPKITVANSEKEGNKELKEVKEQKEIKELKEAKRQEIKCKSQLIEPPGQVKSFLVEKKKQEQSDSDDKTTGKAAPQAPLPVFDCVFCVNDYVVFRKITVDYLNFKYAHPLLESKAYEMAFLGRNRKSKFNKIHIKSLDMNYNFLKNVTKVLQKKQSPTLLKFVFTINSKTKFATRKSMKNYYVKEEIKPNYNFQENKHHEGLYNDNDERNQVDKELEINEAQSEMSLVRVRKSKKPEINISFESDVHNIYDPQFSSTQSSFVEQNSEISSFISIESPLSKKSPSINQKESEIIQKFIEIPKIKIPEVNSNSDIAAKLNIQHEVDGQKLPHNLFRHNSEKQNEQLEQSLEFLLKNEEPHSNRNSYTRYLSGKNNNIKNTMKETINSLCFEFKEGLAHRLSKNFNANNIESNQERNRNKEIPKISFSNELKNTYQIMSPNNVKDKILEAIHTSRDDNIGSHRSLFQNNSALKSMNFGKYVKEQNSIVRERYFNKSLKKTNKDGKLFDSNKTEDINSLKDDRLSPFSQYVINDDQAQIENNCNIPFDFLNSYENDNSKFTSKIIRQHSSVEKADNSIGLKETKKSSNINDFIIKSMNSLKNLQKFVAESSNVSKLRDETLKSIDAVSSPDCGKTKDTSALSGIKFQNKMNTNKTYASMNNSSSILGGVGMNSKFIGENELKLINMIPAKLISHQSLNAKDLSSKSKYLTDKNKPNENSQSSFADRIEAIREKEDHREKVLMETAKFGKNKHVRSSKVSTMAQIAKCHSSRAYQDYSCTSRKSHAAKTSIKKNCDCKSRDPSAKSNASRYSNKERMPICSDSPSITSDFSAKKLQRANSSIQNNSCSKKKKNKRNINKNKLKSANRSGSKARKEAKLLKNKSPNKPYDHTLKIK